MAIVRFVNELVDSLDVTLPVYQLAKMLGIPLYFVEIRHTATHDELPSLELLRQVGVRARTWLWDNYWAKIKEPFAPAVFGADMEIEVKTLTREWRRLRRDSLTREVRRNDISVYGQQYWNLINLFVQHQARDERDMIRVFLTANILVPTDGKSVASRIKLYGPLLKVLAGNGFVDRLVEALIEHLVSLKDKLEVEASKLICDALDTWAGVFFSQSEWFQDPEFVLTLVLERIHAMSLKHLRVLITSLVEANRFILPRCLAKVRAAAQAWEGATEDKTAIEQVLTEVENSLRISQAELDECNTAAKFWQLDSEWDPSHFIGDCS
jgi:hypothetical protein